MSVRVRVTLPGGIRDVVPPSPSTPRPVFPHCDDLVLHAPRECIFCDNHPDEQSARIAAGVNFTGHSDPNKAACPAEARRARNTIDRWHGNRARKASPMLLGSNVLPSMIRIGERDVQLGDVVVRAQRDSPFKTVDEWNKVTPLTREHCLVRTIYAMRAEAEKPCTCAGQVFSTTPQRVGKNPCALHDRSTFVPHEDLPTK